jgi:hypothetical protein
LAPLSRGSTLGSGQHSPPGQKLELEKRLAGNENLKKLARMIGRMKFPVAAPMFSGRSTLLWNACDRRNIKKAISFHHRRRMPGESRVGGAVSQGETKLGFSLYSNLIDVGPSSLGTLREFSDRITTIKQLTGDEAKDFFVSLWSDCAAVFQACFLAH